MNIWSLNGKLKDYIISFIITLPILFQLLLINDKGMIEADIHRWINLKVSIFVLYISWFFLSYVFIIILRKKLKIISIPILFSLIIATYIVVTRQNIEYEVYASINNTTLSEALEFIISYPFLLSFTVVVVLFFVLYVTLLKADDELINKLIINKAHLVLMFSISCVGLIWSYYYARDALYKTYPLSIPFYQKMYITKSYLFKSNFEKINYRFVGKLDTDKNIEETYILVIGETARKHSMSIYGYKRETTPELEKALNNTLLKSAIFNATSSGISTLISVPFLISAANVEDYDKLSSTPTLIHVFNNFKYSTTLISNQETTGRNNDTIAMMLGQMQHIQFISGNATKRKYDIELLEPLNEAIQKTDGKKFIIVHLMGSHWKYEQRYPKEFAIYGDDRIGTYDDSIRYTDFVLGKIFNLIENSNKPIALIYTSDHGENLNDNGDNNYLHAVKEMTKYEIEVPLFITFNNKYYNLKKQKVDRLIRNQSVEVSHDNISHTFLGLAGIYDSNIYRSDYDISSEDFKFMERNSINRRLEIVNVDRYLNNIEPKIKHASYNYETSK